jgi:hypothetical protein
VIEPATPLAPTPSPPHTPPPEPAAPCRPRVRRWPTSSPARRGATATGRWTTSRRMTCSSTTGSPTSPAAGRGQPGLCTCGASGGGLLSVGPAGAGEERAGGRGGGGGGHAACRQAAGAAVQQQLLWALLLLPRPSPRSASASRAPAGTPGRRPTLSSPTSSGGLSAGGSQGRRGSRSSRRGSRGSSSGSRGSSSGASEHVASRPVAEAGVGAAGPARLGGLRCVCMGGLCVL